VKAENLGCFFTTSPELFIPVFKNKTKENNKKRSNPSPHKKNFHKKGTWAFVSVPLLSFVVKNINSLWALSTFFLWSIWIKSSLWAEITFYLSPVPPRKPSMKPSHNISPQIWNMSPSLTYRTHFR
jgi:hypothetical protein